MCNKNGNTRYTALCFKLGYQKKSKKLLKVMANRKQIKKSYGVKI